MTPAEVPVELRERTFEAVLFDWDGTAVPDQDADAMEARALVEELCASGPPADLRHRLRAAPRRLMAPTSMVPTSMPQRLMAPVRSGVTAGNWKEADPEWWSPRGTNRSGRFAWA